VEGTATWERLDAGPDLVDTTHPGGRRSLRGSRVGASTTPGQVTLSQKIPNATTVNPPTTRWLYSGSSNVTHYLSFKTPVGAMPENQCGKVVYACMHVASRTVTSFPRAAAQAHRRREGARACSSTSVRASINLLR
jgi:hypothetical protein